LASAAFARGIRTLVVDLDPQCDATNGLGAVGDFRETVADVLQNPRHNVVHRAIVASSWGKDRAEQIHVMVGSPRCIAFDTPTPTLGDVWKLEEAFSRIEKDYDLVIIDTPPSVNGLTRTAWVASDRVLLVSEPSFFSVVAAERATRAIDELSKGITPRLKVLGILVNRLRPQSKEHEFRVNELKEMFGNLLLPVKMDERATLQQAQGATRPIHSWPGESAAEAAGIFEEVLDIAFESIANPANRRSDKMDQKVARLNKVMRGQSLEQVLTLEAMQETEAVEGPEIPVESDQAPTRRQLREGN
jgi:cellulose biosynthesis protein BcsQ